MPNRDDIVENLKEQGLFKERDLSAHEFKGLVEHSHHILKCSCCARSLVDLCVTRPNEPEIWQVKCHCPYCDDYSFESEIQGGFIIGYLENGPKLADIETDGNKVKIITIK